MTDPKYLRANDVPFALAHVAEECGEVLAALGKCQRWGLQSVNPELPADQQETNEAWLLREIVDLRGALDRLQWQLEVDPADGLPMGRSFETSASIAGWADQTFGDAGSDARVVARANEEMAELLRAVTSGKPGAAIVEEAADVVIILCRLAARNDSDLWEAVELKMAVNRKREWKTDGTGHGYHVRDKAA